MYGSIISGLNEMLSFFALSLPSLSFDAPLLLIPNPFCISYGEAVVCGF